MDFYYKIFLIPADSTCCHHLQKITSCFIQEYVILTVLKLSPISFMKRCPVLAGFYQGQLCLLSTHRSHDFVNLSPTTLWWP